MSGPLRDLLVELGVSHADERARQLDAYLELIQRYGRRINLVGNLDADFIRRQLIGGSFQILRVATPRGRLVDVGSGAGLPGIPLALALPELQVTLVEIRQKRAAFLRRARQLLELDNVTVFDGDVAQIDTEFDWAVSRAFKPPDEWLEIALPLVRRGGRVGIYTTRRLWEQLRSSRDLSVLGLDADPTGEDRIVVCVET